MNVYEYYRQREKYSVPYKIIYDYPLSKIT